MFSLFFKACKKISEYIHNRRIQKEVLVSSAIQQILFNMTEEFLNINETAMWDGAWKFADEMFQKLVNANHSILDDGKVEKGTFQSFGFRPDYMIPNLK